MKQAKGSVVVWAWLPLLVSGMAGASARDVKESDKLAEDPTKVVTQVGVSYADQLKISGSLSLDPVRKINASMNKDASEWRLGGSWLFDFGILNFNFSRKQFDHGANQTSYNVGTFVPLSAMGFAPGGWQIFPTAGLNYNDGDIACEVGSQGCGMVNVDTSSDFVLIPNASKGGYLGAFALKPLAPEWTLITFGVGSLGSNDYHGYVLGLGMGYKFTERQSISTYAYTSDNSFGSDQQLGIAYRYQFN
ncbi:hypothetical protein DRM94_14090 [Aeromonas taiwanensis]|uniref:Uncharacterized protein n=1 Tax=Aeromonas taiwanensis TaxID=633417 RepID=A0A5F0K8F7_9GAMM|nr:hypothetical protein [Aeromonas taiwanensis]TFF73823.1 hypothetical protein DRM93_14090 [Aeromonas taiwanensis]TFF74710.1 hypothetical protein DRM95_14130 [Aeromonas taiwanensis]TFF77979.1 hypothetical protein DRM94_14090 [Aeromonas taiwanensis]